MAKNTELKFAPLGQGVQFAVEGQTLHIRVDLDPKNAVASASGKMALSGNTGGWQTLPDGSGLRANVMVGRKAAA